MNDEFPTRYFIRNGILYKSCPACSKQLGDDVYYQCPERFGYRSNIIQSQCKNCRSRKIGPFEGYVLKEEVECCIPEIRCLPMGKDEFPTVDDCVEFLTIEMPERGNTFYYISHNLVTKPNSLILFQYDGMIIGYGFYESECSEDYGIYKGYYKFKDDSIKILDEFIPNSYIKENFNISLGQGTIHIAMSYMHTILKKLKLINDVDIVDHSYDIVDNIDYESENDKLINDINEALKKIKNEKLFALSNDVIMEETELDIVPYNGINRDAISKKKSNPNYFNKITREYLKTKDSKLIEDYVFKMECEKVKTMICDGLEDDLLKQMHDFYDNRKDIDGFDILSFEKIDDNIVKKFIDVKSTKNNNKTPIDISRNEYEFAKENIDNYYIYRVVIVDNSTLKICEISGRELFNIEKYNIEATEFKIYGSGCNEE